MSSGASSRCQAHLKRPEQPGANDPEALRGNIPIAVATRKPDPLVVPLAGASGKSFRNDQVHPHHPGAPAQPERQPDDASIWWSGLRRGGGGRPPGAGGAEFSLPRHDMHQQQIEVLDAKGQVIPWYPTSFDAEGSRMTLTIAPRTAWPSPPRSATTAWRGPRPKSSSSSPTSSMP